MTNPINQKHVLLDARVLYGGYDFSGLNSVDFENGMDPVEVTAFRNYNHVYAPGLGGAKVSMEGFTKYGAAGNEVQVSSAILNRTIKEFSISPRGEIGDRAYFFRVMTADFKGLGAVGQAEKFSLSVQAARGEPAIPGKVLESGMTSSIVTAKTASGTSAPQNLGAVAATQSLWAILHCFQVPVEITVPQITANQNNFAPASFSTAWSLLLSSDASRNITGLAGGYAGRIIKLTNAGSQDIVLKHEDAASTAANRFNLAGGVDLTLAPAATVKLGYNTGTSRWDVVVTAFPTLIVKLQSDSAEAFTTPADVWTYSTFGTSVGSEFKEITGPITDTWFRFSWAIVGGGPYNLAGSAGIF